MSAGDAAAAAVADLCWLDATSDARWAAFVAARGASVFHSPAWARVLSDAYGLAVQAVALSEAQGALAAGVPFCRIDDVIGRRIVVLPFCDYCDPVVGDAAGWPRLLDALAAFGVPILLGALDGAVAAADGRMAVIKRSVWHGVDLDADAGALWARLAPQTRRAVRKAEREGVTVERIDDERFLHEFLAMHVAVRKRKYRLLAQPAGFFEAVRRHFSAAGDWLPLAAYHRGRCIAATIFLAWGDTLYYRFNTSRADALAVRPNDLLLWAGIRHALARGLRCLDLGRSDLDQPGLIRFKRQLGAREREIRVLRYDPPGYDGAHERAARAALHTMTQLLTDASVPDPLTAAAGAALYRFFA